MTANGAVVVFWAGKANGGLLLPVTAVREVI